MLNKITNAVHYVNLQDHLLHNYPCIIDTVRENYTALEAQYALSCHGYDICIVFKAKFLKKEAK